MKAQPLLETKYLTISTKLDTAQNRLDEILPRPRITENPQRRKRGLLNSLGSVIKDITGNLDNNDLKDIQKAINDIQTGQNKLVQNNNKQYDINKQIITRLEEQNTYYKENIITINKTLNKITANLNLDKYETYIIHDTQLYKLEHVIDKLNEHLEQLLDIIAFSKNRIISRHLLNKEEFRYIVNTINQNSIHIPHELAILNLLEVKGLINQNSQLIFLINIPYFNPETFQLHKIIPTNILNTKIFPTPPEYLITNNYQYMAYNPDQCQSIYGKHYCQPGEPKPIANTCAPAIIQQQTAICNTTNTARKNQIIPINDHTIFLSPDSNNITFQSNCTRTTDKIYTTIIIKFSGCYIKINNATYANQPNITFTYQIHQFPWNKVSINDTIPTINIHEMTNWTIGNIEELQENHNQYKFHTNTQYSLLSLMGTIILAIIIYKVGPPLFRRFLRNRRNNLVGEELRRSIPLSSTRVIPEQVTVTPVIKPVITNTSKERIL